MAAPLKSPETCHYFMPSDAEEVKRSASNIKYCAGSNSLGIDRLTVQQWVIKHFWHKGHNLVFAPLSLRDSSNEKPIHVLDAGAGTGMMDFDESKNGESYGLYQGIWSVELAQECPKTTTFTLLDYKPEVCHDAYPSLPENIKLHGFNLLEDFKKHPEWKGHFDLVHERLTFFAWTPDNWRNVLKSYFEVLKPGGYIQLWEVDTRSRDIFNLGPWFNFGADWGLELTKRRGIKHDIIDDLPKLLEEAAFAVSSKEPYDIDFSHGLTQPEPFPGALEFWYKQLPHSLCISGREQGLIGDKEWKEFEEGLKDEFQLADKSKFAFRAWVIVAQVSLP
jgi:SAM-dependent methyltransferase